MNITSSGSSSLHSLPPHFFTSLIDESVDTSPPEEQELVSCNFSFPGRVKAQSSYGSALPKFRGMQKLMQKESRISKTPKIGRTSVSAGRQLMKTSSGVKSANDTSVVYGSMKLTTTPTTRKLKTDSADRTKLVKDQKTPKSPKKNLSDIPDEMQQRKTPRDLRSPRNDLGNIFGVKRLMKTPKCPISPNNDLRDVRGIKQLLMTPKSPKSPKNDLSDVRGVRKLMATPRSPKSPKNF
jgi:antigen KI-67